MCWQCENPGTNWQDYVEHLRDVLERHCWVVQGVQRERQRPAYAYTIGLAAHGRPELAVTGLPYDRAAALLNSAARHVLNTDALRPGEQVALRGGPVTEIVRIAEPGVHLPAAAAVNGPGFMALQLVYADERGHWPWESSFRRGGGGQPVLGVRVALSPHADRTGRTGRA
jgi:hypothetical protein